MFMQWLGISLVALGSVMLVAVAVAAWLSGAWAMGLVLGVLAAVSLVCTVCMARITLEG